MSWILKVNAYLKGFRTILTTTVGSLFNLLVMTHVIKVSIEGYAAANVGFLVIAGVFRILANDPEPLQ